MMWNLNLEFSDLVVFFVLIYFFGVLILESGSWILGFGSGSLGFVSMTPATTKETRFLDLFVCTLVGRPWC